MLVTACLKRVLTLTASAVEGRATPRRQATHLSFVALLAIVAVAGLAAAKPGT